MSTISRKPGGRTTARHAAKPAARRKSSKPAKSTSPRDQTEATLREIWGQVAQEQSATEARRVAEQKAEAQKAQARELALQKTLGGIKTGADFAAQPADVQRTAITRGGPDGGRWSIGDFEPATKVHSAAERKLAKAMIEHVKQQMDLEVDPDQFATVGDPGFAVSLLHLPNGDLVGGEIRVAQQGVEVFEVAPDRVQSHYDTLSAAQRAGAQENDIAWTGTAVFNAAGKLLEVDPALTWSGY